MRYHLRSIFEDTKHGADMQSSTILLNFHTACLLENSVPEIWRIGTDNTQKETKNSTTLNACIWMLCALRETRLWCVNLSFLMVGHTHDSLDRFFSRLCRALKGKDYWTLPDMADAVNKALAGQDIMWQHLDCTWNFTSLRSAIGIEFHRLRNVHDIELYRTDDGLYCRWKQWLTDEVWSRPLLLLNSQDVVRVGELEPVRVPNRFDDGQQAKMLAWLDKIRVHIAASGQDKNRELEWLRRVVQGSEPTLQPRLTIADMLRNIRSCDGRAAPKSAREAEFPMDVLGQLFPGADITGMPVNTLLSVVGSAEQQQRAHKATCEPGDMVLLAGEMKHNALPFHVGVIMELLPTGSALVQWLVPGESKHASFRGGRKRLVTDVFGPWYTADDQVVASLPALPSAVVQPCSVLEWCFELEDDCLPFGILDKLVDVHFIDVTGLNLSSTPRGNLFRTHRLMRSMQA